MADPRREIMRAAIREAGGPGTKEGWATLWKKDLTLWDLGKPTPLMIDEVTRAVVEGRLRLSDSTLVPGCGAGYDVKALAQAGFKKVVGLDIAEEAVQRAREVLGDSTPGGQVLCGDFFDTTALPNGSQKFMFDYTFFCAIPPSLRASWGARTASLLEEGGRLLTLAFPLNTDEVASDPSTPGPPHAVSLSEYKKALEPHGMRLERGPTASPLSVRQGEQVIWWVKGAPVKC